MPALATEMRSYTTLEVARHNSAQDAWIIVKGKVYDVTQFAHEHPGGDDVLLEAAGRDATREFEDVGHSGDARRQLDALQIGVVRAPADDEPRKGKAAARARRDAASDVARWLSGVELKHVGVATLVLLGVYATRRYMLAKLRAQ